MADRIPSLTGRQVCRMLKKAGFEEVPGRGKGGHLFLYRDSPPTPLVIPGLGDIKRGTLRAIIRQSGLNLDEFLDLK